ncbi:MAG: hypothetical protein KC503_17555 [Myxococcales bacterium]|nr:hypothetical protein [Myxococcales bacterium]
MSRKAIKEKAKRKGQVAGGAAVGSAVLLAVGAWPIGLIGAGIAGWAAWDWFRYRARNGMRF